MIFDSITKHFNKSYATEERTDKVFDMFNTSHIKSQPLDWDLFSALIKEGVDFEKEEKGSAGTLLLSAVFFNQEKAALHLIENGSNMHTPAKKSKITPLMCATINHRQNIFDFILSHSNVSQINATDGFGNTALHHACHQGKRKALQTLLLAGADPNIKNNKGQTVYDIVHANEDLQKPFENALQELEIRKANHAKDFIRKTSTTQKNIPLKRAKFKSKGQS